MLYHTHLLTVCNVCSINYQLLEGVEVNGIHDSSPLRSLHCERTEERLDGMKTLLNRCKIKMVQ